MEEKKIKSQGFYIHDFMSELGLSGAMLSVYALIYSFSVGAYGLFYGSQEYIANTLGVSTKTVQRTLKGLRERGLIEKCELDGKRGYRTVECFYKKEEPTELLTANTDALLYENDEYDSEKCHEEFEDNHGNVINERTESFKESYEKCHRYCRPKYEKLSFGRHGLVGLTREQYDGLRRLIDLETLNVYISRYEQMAEKKFENRKPLPKNEYRVIKKWIEEANAI